MKTLLIVLTMFVSGTAMADCKVVSSTQTTEEKKDVNTEVPPDLKDATIIVRTADGKERVMKANTFKVVPRKQQFVVTKIKQVDKIECTPTVVEKPMRKNRLSLVAGQSAREGLDRSNYPTSVEIESKIGLAVGLQYQRLVTERVSVGGELITSRAALLTLGYDF